MEKIRQIADENRKLEDSFHIAPHIPVCEFARTFNGLYMDIVTKTQKQFHALRKEMISDTLDVCKSYPTVHNELNAVFDEIITKQNESLEYDIHALAMKNTHRDLINTTNAHYLTSKFATRIEDITKTKSLANDDSKFEVLLIHVEAYLDTQIKYIQERVQEMFYRHYIIWTEELFTKYLEDRPKLPPWQTHLKPIIRLQSISKCMEQPRLIQRQRRHALKDLSVLNKILSTL